jgi:hypothetical protein
MIGNAKQYGVIQPRIGQASVITQHAFTPRPELFGGALRAQVAGGGFNCPRTIRPFSKAGLSITYLIVLLRPLPCWRRSSQVQPISAAGKLRTKSANRGGRPVVRPRGWSRVMPALRVVRASSRGINQGAECHSYAPASHDWLRQGSPTPEYQHRPSARCAIHHAAG